LSYHAYKQTHATRRKQTDVIVLGIGTECSHVQSRAYINDF